MKDADPTTVRGSLVRLTSLSKRMAALALALTLAACATTQNHDPLEPMNRKIFGFNEAMDQVFIRPVATGYAAVVPSFVQTAFGNVINNLKDVWSAANLFLQGRPGEGAQEILRVGINTTMGFAGLIDLATPMQLERHNEDLGQTFGVWGVPNGAYLVLPILGPSTVRDTVGLPADLYFSPAMLFRQVPDINTARALTVIHTRAQLLDATSLMSDVALDKYAFVRDAYLQRRRNLIYNGDPPDDEFSLGVEPRCLPAQQPASALAEESLSVSLDVSPLSDPLPLAAAPVAAEVQPALAAPVGEETLASLPNPVDLR